MKSREISRSKIGPFSLASNDPYIGIRWEYQSKESLELRSNLLKSWGRSYTYKYQCQRMIHAAPDQGEKIICW